MSEHVDVLFIGAGISGIGSACHLRQQLPGKSFLIVEAHETFGGTWHIHRYPGVRSDSDLFTFGYRFKPWQGRPIAKAADILRYLGEVIEEHGLAGHIRYGRKVIAAEWSSAEARWTLTIQRKADGAVETMTAGFIWSGAGYYRHEQGYTPDWPGLADFAGRLIHPQDWPEGIDLAASRVVVIGSGATAATLVPALAGKCGALTMLQRSPTYFFTGTNRNELADMLRDLEIDPVWIHEIVRRKILAEQKSQIDLALAFPEEAKAGLIQSVRDIVGDAVDVDRHFTPPYAPLHQRIAFIPDNDLFHAVKRGAVDLVTDRIARFVPEGIELESGRILEADVVVTATGFDLSVLGDMAVIVDGKAVDPAQELTWRGVLMTGVPNLVWVFGYFLASWTLRVDILGDFVCRLLRHMDENAHRSVRAIADPAMPRLSWQDGQTFTPGYMQRRAHIMPQRGTGPEWTHTQDYWTERTELAALDLTSVPLQFV